LLVDFSSERINEGVDTTTARSERTSYGLFDGGKTVKPSHCGRQLIVRYRCIISCSMHERT